MLLKLIILGKIYVNKISKNPLKNVDVNGKIVQEKYIIIFLIVLCLYL